MYRYIFGVEVTISFFNLKVDPLLLDLAGYHCIRSFFEAINLAERKLRRLQHSQQLVRKGKSEKSSNGSGDSCTLRGRGGGGVRKCLQTCTLCILQYIVHVHVLLQIIDSQDLSGIEYLWKVSGGNVHVYCNYSLP